MSESAVLSARLIGEIFVERGLITAEQLEEAVELQQASGDMIGEVLVASFGVSRIELASVLAEQWAAMEREARGRETGEATPTPTLPEHAARDVSGEDDDETAQRRPIGEIFVERGMATEAQLEHALEEQRQTGERLGEILVRMGVIERLELAGALAEQWSGLQKLRPPAPKRPEPWQETALAQSASAPPSTTSAAPVADLGPLQESVATLQRQVTALAARPDPDLTVLRGETRAVEQRLAEVEERLAATAGADAVADLSAALAELRAVVESQASGLALDAAVASLTARVDALGAGDLEGRVDDALGSIEAVREEISRIDVLARAAARAEDVESVAGHVEGVRDESATRVAALSERLEALAARVDALGGEGAPGDVSDAGALDELHAALADVRARVAGLTDSVEARLAATAEGLELVDEHRVRTDESLGALAARVEEIERSSLGTDATAEQDERLARLADAVSGLEARLGGLARTDDLDAARGALEERLQGAFEAVDGLQARIEALPEAREDERLAALAELRARIDQLAEASASTAAEPNEALGALHDRIGLLDEQLARAWAEVEARAPRAELEAEAARVGGEIAALRAQLEGLAADERDRGDLDVALDLITALDERIAGLEARPWAPPEDADALRARIEEVVHGLAEVRGSLAAVPDPARIDGLSTAIDEAHARIGALQQQLEDDELSARLSGLRAELDERLDDLAGAFEELRSQPPASADVAGRVSELAVTIEELQASLAEQERSRDAAGLGQRLEALAERLDADEGARRALEDDLRARVEAVRARAEQVAGAEQEARADMRTALHDELLRRVQELAPDDRVDALSSAIDSLRVELGSRFDEVVSHESLDAVTHALAQRFDVLERRVGAMAGQEALDALVADIGERLAALGSVAHEAAARAGEAKEAALAAVDERTAHLVGREELDGRIADLVDRAELDERTADLVGRGELDARTAGLVAREELDARAAGLVGREELDARTAGLVGREELEQRTADLVGRDELDGRIADVVGRKELKQRTAGLVGREELDARTADLVGREELDARTADLVGREELDARTACLVGRAELDEREEGLVRREELEHRTAGLVGRDELGQRLHEVAGAGIEAVGHVAASVDALAAELREALAHVHHRIDELAAGLGHFTGRLAAVEQTTSDDERLNAVAADLAALGARVDHEASLAEERSVASERAIRKGLAGLGERLVAGEQAYLETGAALRRSIERLGAAVVEADARIGGEPLDPPTLGFVAFMPTADGYRLRALDGVVPEVDSVVQVEEDGPWYRVVRSTVSPLPLDRRSCVYLESA